MSRKQFLKDMRRGTRVRCDDRRHSDSDTVSTASVSFTSHVSNPTLEGGYETHESLIDTPKVCTDSRERNELMVCDDIDESKLPPYSSVTLEHDRSSLAIVRDFQVSGEVKGRNDVETRINPTHVFPNRRDTSDPNNVITNSSETFFIRGAKGGNVHQNECCLIFSQPRINTASTLNAPIEQIEKLADSDSAQMVTKVLSSRGLNFSAATTSNTVVPIRNSSEVSEIMLKSVDDVTFSSIEPPVAGKRSLQSTYTTSDWCSSSRKNDKKTCNQDNAKAVPTIPFNTGSSSLLPSDNTCIAPSQIKLNTPLEPNTCNNNKFKSVNNNEISLSSIQIELAKEKNRNIHAEQMISKLNHEVEILKAENLAFSTKLSLVTTANDKVGKNVEAKAQTTPSALAIYVAELEDRISKITSLLESKESEIESKDERIRLLEHTLANQILLNTVPPTATSTSTTVPSHGVVHMKTRGEPRVANIPDILSRSQTPASAAVLQTKASSLHESSVGSGKAHYTDKLSTVMTSDRSLVEQSDATTELSAPRINPTIKFSEKIQHPALDSTTTMSKNLPHPMRNAACARSKSKSRNDPSIDPSKDNSKTLQNHRSVSPSPLRSSRSAHRSEAVHKVEGSSARIQDSSHLLICSKEVPHPSVDHASCSKRNSNSQSARASPRKPSVRKGLRRSSSRSADLLMGTNAPVESRDRFISPSPRSATAMRNTFSHPYRMNGVAAPSLTVGSAMPTSEHPRPAASRQPSKPLCSMMRVWGPRDRKSISPHGPPSLRSATSMGSRPRILLNEKGDTTLMQGKTTTVVFRSSRSRQSTPVVNGINTAREPLITTASRVSLIPEVGPEQPTAKCSVDK